MDEVCEVSSLSIPNRASEPDGKKETQIVSSMMDGMWCMVCMVFE
jgi:hypothetical protein